MNDEAKIVPIDRKRTRPPCLFGNAKCACKYEMGFETFLYIFLVIFSLTAGCTLKYLCFYNRLIPLTVYFAGFCHSFN